MMSLIRKLVYDVGFRPSQHSILYSPSRSTIEAWSGSIEAYKKGLETPIAIRPELLDPQIPRLVCVNYGGFPLYIPQWLYDEPKFKELNLKDWED